MKKSRNQGAASSLSSKKPVKSGETSQEAGKRKIGVKETMPSVETGATGNGKESFFAEVFRLVRQVPKGRVTSYGDIANGAQAKITARMVGWAMHAAGSAKPPVPAHRVVNSSGVLSGRQAFPTPTLMQELLAKEGVVVKNDKVQNFAKLRWAPPPAQNKDMPVVKGPK